MQFLNDPLAALGLSDAAGADSGAMTPEALELRRKMALAMMQQGQSDPVKSTTQGINSVLKSIIGAYQMKKADQEDKHGKKEADDLLAQVFGGGGAKPVAPASEPIPGTSIMRDSSPGSLTSGATGDIAPYANAIASIESAGSKNPYVAIGPQTRSGDRALGKYQVMGKNVPEWTEKHLGRRMTTAEFLRDPDAQEKVFAGEFGGYLKKYGNPDDAASMWFSGKPAAQGRDTDDLYTSQPEYLKRFNAALKAGGGAQTAAASAGTMSDAGPGAAPAPVRTAMASPEQNTMTQRALLLMKNPRTAPLGQALLQKALTTEAKDPLIVKVPGEDGAEVQMIYDRATNSLKPMSSLLPGQAEASPAAALPIAPPAAQPAPLPSAAPAGPAVTNVGEVGPGPQELAAMASPLVGGVQQANMAGKGDLGGTGPAVPSQAAVAPSVAPEAPPVPAQVPVSALAVPDAPPGSQPGMQWKGKNPEGYIQRQFPNGEWMVDGSRRPVFELKSEADARAKATEKRSDAAVTAEQQVGGVSDVISAARKVAELPGFEGAQKLGRASFDVSVPFQGGRIGGDVMSLPKSVGRMIDPDNPAYAAADQIQSTQRSLELLVARPLMKGQGQVTDSERTMITEAIGNLSKATSPADYQFKLNKVEGMIKAMNVQGGVSRAAASNGAPSTAEIQSAVDMSKGTFSTAKVMELAKKYNVPAVDMQKYITTQAMRGRETNKPAVAVKQPESVMEAMMARMGIQ